MTMPRKRHCSGAGPFQITSLEEDDVRTLLASLVIAAVLSLFGSVAIQAAGDIGPGEGSAYLMAGDIGPGEG
jgi:hypothetical protein